MKITVRYVFKGEVHSKMAYFLFRSIKTLSKEKSVPEISASKDLSNLTKSLSKAARNRTQTPPSWTCA